MKRPCPELFRGTVSASRAAEDKSGTASRTSVTWEGLPLVALQHRVVWRGMALVVDDDVDDDTWRSSLSNAQHN